jgi:transcriptional regulator with XRE-family HTH domain
MELKHFLRNKRTELLQTQKQSAEKVGVTPLTWVSWERGQMPGVLHIFKIADWAGVKIDDLRPYLVQETKKEP